MNITQLTNWNGEVKRRDYLLWGSILFALKYNIDRLIGQMSDKRWFITDYFIQADRLSIQELTDDDRKFYLLLLIWSLPFIWFGTMLTLKRLRDAKLPTWLVIFFFIPFINFLLFLLLSAIPSRDANTAFRFNFIDRLIPKSKIGSAMFAVGVVTFISLVIGGAMFSYLKDYGWSLFIGIPFFLGFGSVLLYGHSTPLGIREALGVALASVFFFFVFIFFLAMEGLVCIAMAFPIFLIVAFIGAIIGLAIHRNRQSTSLNVFVVPIIALPLAGLIEHLDRATPPTVTVVSEIIIHAPKQTVWNEVVAFSKIDEPAEFIFRSGIAYPTHAEIDRRGVGAIRKCNFTTGCFIEPITIWNEPNLLEFGVLDQPPPMVELSIYDHLEMAHLDGYFKSVKGQFKLETLTDGQTRLIGTTWYHHNIWPSRYWKLWSDYILHRIHMRVLTHIKQKVEQDQ